MWSSKRIGCRTTSVSRNCDTCNSEDSKRHTGHVIPGLRSLNMARCQRNMRDNTWWPFTTGLPNAATAMAGRKAIGHHQRRESPAVWPRIGPLHKPRRKQSICGHDLTCVHDLLLDQTVSIPRRAARSGQRPSVAIPYYSVDVRHAMNKLLTIGQGRLVLASAKCLSSRE